MEQIAQPRYQMILENVPLAKNAEGVRTHPFRCVNPVSTMGLLNTFAFQVIHAHDWMVGHASESLARVFDIPRIVTHASEFGRNKGIQTELQRYIDDCERRLVENSELTIVNSKLMQDELTARWNVPPEQVIIIPNGVDPNKFESESESHILRQKHGFPAKGPLVLYVGRLVWEKGVHVLLKSAPKILKQSPDATFLIAGTGDDKYTAELREIAQSMGIAHHVRFLGHAADQYLVELYRVADCLAVPSLYEPFGLVALEGMAAGVPVVTSDRGGLAITNLHMETGLTTFAEDPDSLAWGVLKIINDPELAEKLKSKAYEHVSVSYSWRSIAQNTLTAYKTACGLAAFKK